MREILFRIYYQHSETGGIASREIELGQPIPDLGEGWYIIGRCQFTGCYDSTKWQDLTESEREQWTRSGNMPSEWNGKLIFDGDRAKLKYHTAIYVCTFAKDLCAFVWACEVTNKWRTMKEESKIIDNIHDKKEGA